MIDMREIKSINVLALAYLGDAVYELHIREYLLNNGIEKVENLQKEAVNFVSAKNQAKILQALMDNEFFTEEELQVIYRARNHKGNKHPKNTDVITYKYSTGLEALIGHLYLSNEIDRIKQIMKQIL